MALVYPTSDIIRSGEAISDTTTPAIAAGDLLLIDETISVISTGSIGINAGVIGSISIENHGLIGASSQAIYDYKLSGGQNVTIYNGVTGRITSDNANTIYIGGDALAFAHRVDIVNAGQITGHSEGAILVFRTDVATIANSGMITSFDADGAYTSVLFYDVSYVRGSNSGTIVGSDTNGAVLEAPHQAAVGFSNGTEDVVFNNTGTIAAPVFAIGSDALVHELIINGGTLDGDVVLSDTIGGTLRNSGAIWGDVDLRGGGDNYRGYGDGFVSGTVFGGAGADVLVGSNAADRFEGGTEADTLRGKAGDDTLDGGDGADELYTGTGDDEAYGGAGADKVWGQAGDDLLILGGGNDKGWGGAGSDTISGGSGNDTIDGGAGDDTLTGGVGKDVFVFRRDTGHDVITDFTNGDDDIDISVLGLANFAALNGAGAVSGDATITVIDMTKVGAVGSITLLGFDVALLNGADFIF